MPQWVQTGRAGVFCLSSDTVLGNAHNEQLRCHWIYIHTGPRAERQGRWRLSHTEWRFFEGMGCQVMSNWRIVPQYKPDVNSMVVTLFKLHLFFFTRNLHKRDLPGTIRANPFQILNNGVSRECWDAGMTLVEGKHSLILGECGFVNDDAQTYATSVLCK